MSTFFLRSLVHQGFCGQYQDVHVDRGLGYVQAMLDQIIYREPLDGLDNESKRTQLALQRDIPYEHRVTFDRCLQGIFEKRHQFEGGGIDSKWLESYAGDSHTLEYARLTIGKTYIEPMYSFYPMDSYLPLHSLIIAQRSGLSTARVRSVSVVGDITIEEEYPILDEVINAMLFRATNDAITPGVQCRTCTKKECPSASTFEQLVMSWMKTRQAAEAAQEELRQYLVAHGPTKCGAHIIYMKENTRRYYKDKDFMTLYTRLCAEAPKDFVKYLNPDSAEIAKAIEEGDLPKSFLDFFKTSRYYTIDSNVSL